MSRLPARTPLPSLVSAASRPAGLSCPGCTARHLSSTPRRRSSSSNDKLPSPPTGTILSRTAASLLPPIPLYRRILRSHRLALPYDMRSLGDTYVKDEFRRHRKVDNPLQIVGFLGQWKQYLDMLEAQVRAQRGQAEGEPVGEEQGNGKRFFFEGKKLSNDEFNKLSEEQMYQLHEFMQAAKELYNPTAPGPPGPPGSEGSSSSEEGHTAQTAEMGMEKGEGERVLQEILDASEGKKR